MAKIAYSLEEAADNVGYSLSVIKRAIRAGEIIPRFANTKPVILHSDLVEWAEALPLDKP